MKGVSSLAFRAARQLDTLMQALTVPLTRYTADFPSPEALHPFERALLELTVGEERYVTALDRVAALRKPLSEVRPEAPRQQPVITHVQKASHCPRAAASTPTKRVSHQWTAGLHLQSNACGQVVFRVVGKHLHSDAH